MHAGGGRERRRGTRAAVLLVAALGALALPACSDGDDGARADPEPTDAGSVPVEAVDGGRLRIALGGPIVVDPVEASLASAGQLMVLDLLHDGLARLSPEGTPQPALAASWTPNADRTAWEFALAPSAVFSDGEPVTAADVVASLERVAAVGETSLAALRLEHVKGFAAFVAGTSERLEGLSAPDDTTVRVALDEPVSVLPQLLASPVYGVVDVESVTGADGGDLTDLPLSGGWTVASADDDGVVLARNADRPGHLEEVVLRAYDDPGDAYDAFDDGEVDWAAVPGEDLEDAVERHGDDHFTAFHAELAFGMNVRSGHLLSNRRLRQAIAAAIDREAIVEEVFADLAEPLESIVPVGVAGYDPITCDACGYDPDRAEELVQAAFPDGDVPEVHIDFDESPAQEAMVEIVADGLEAVGIPTSLRPRPRADYKRFVTGGEQELFSFGWIGLYGSADAYLTPQLQSSSDDNLTGYRSPAVDLLLAGARASGAPAERLGLWATVEQTALEAAVVVPVAQFRTQVVVSPRVQGLAHAVDGTVDWAQVWLADAG